MISTAISNPPRQIATVLIQPGWRNSGPDHWQSRWEREFGPHAARVPQRDWDTPECSAWVATLAGSVDEAAAPLLLLAHSIGCIAAAHLLTGRTGSVALEKVAAAVLVAPADVEREDAAPTLRSFAPIPMEPIAVPTLVVASSNDPYCSESRAQELAHGWRADVEIIRDAGHINDVSGFGPWREGRTLIGEWLKRRALSWEGMVAS